MVFGDTIARRNLPWDYFYYYWWVDPVDLPPARIEIVPETEPVRPLKSFDISRASANELIEILGDPNLTLRLLATDQLVDRIGEAAVEPARRACRSDGAPDTTRAHGLWVLHRLGALDEQTLTQAATSPSSLVRTHALRALAA